MYIVPLDYSQSIGLGFVQMQMDLQEGLAVYDAHPALVAKIMLRSQDFSWKASAKSYLETYQQILRQR